MNKNTQMCMQLLYIICAYEPLFVLVGEYMTKQNTNLTLKTDIKIRAINAVKSGKFSGISSLSALVDAALDDKLKTIEEA